MKILGMGNALVDIMTSMTDDAILSKHNLPKGSMQLVDDVRSAAIQEDASKFDQTLTSGGAAANTIRGVAALGVDVGFIGCISDDKLGDIFRRDMEKHKVVPHLFKGNKNTGNAIALVSPDSERTFAVSLGAAIELTDAHLSIDLFAGYDYFYIEGYLVQNHALIEKAIKLAKESGARICLDLASFNVVEDNKEFLERMVSDYVDIVFANEEESKALTGKEPEEALDILANKCEMAIVKIGKHGSMIKKGNETYTIGVIDAISRDTTGAGDWYAAGFLYGLSKGLDLKKCGMIGAVLSGKVIEVIGAIIDPERWEQARNMISKVEETGYWA